MGEDKAGEAPFTAARIGTFFRQHALYTGAAVLIASAIYGCCFLAARDGIAGLALTAVICAVLPNLLFLLIWRRTERFQDAARWIDRRFHLPDFVRRLVIRQP